MFFRPTPQQERWIRVAARLGVRRDTPWLADRCGGWTAATTIARCTFFALGLLAAGLTAAILGLIHVPGYLFITGLVAIVAAEWLILDKHLFGAGIEEALEVSGLLMIALQIVDPFFSSSAVRAPLLIALAFAVAGFRLLNPLFITLSAVALSYAMESAGALYGGPSVFPASMAATFCFAFAAAALLIGRARFRRPAHDGMLNWLIVATPLAGYLWVESKHASGLTLDLLRQAPVRSVPALVLMTYGIAALIAGIRRRTHAPIMAFILCAGCAAYEFRNLTSLSLQVKLIGWEASCCSSRWHWIGTCVRLAGESPRNDSRRTRAPSISCSSPPRALSHHLPSKIPAHNSKAVAARAPAAVPAAVDRREPRAPSLSAIQ